jgi:hypothetical protein
LHLSEAAIGATHLPPSQRILSPGHPWGPITQRWDIMNFARKIAFVVASATLSVGLLGISAPAHADFTWGQSVKR